MSDSVGERARRASAVLAAQRARRGGRSFGGEDAPLAPDPAAGPAPMPADVGGMGAMRGNAAPVARARRANPAGAANAGGADNLNAAALRLAQGEAPRNDMERMIKARMDELAAGGGGGSEFRQYRKGGAVKAYKKGGVVGKKPGFPAPAPKGKVPPFGKKAPAGKAPPPFKKGGKVMGKGK